MVKKERKCIAVIISKPERKYQEGLLKGICDSAFEKGMNVAVFATSLLEGLEGYLWGEEEIFNIIQYEKFSGVIYARGSFYDEGVIKRLNESMVEVAAKGIPVVAVDGKVEGLPSFFNDDSHAVVEIIDHLVNAHNVRDIAYMTGHKGHTHAENSLRSYREGMAKHGIEVTEDRVYYGDYWYNESENFVKQLENSERGYPEAIIAANEYMAIGLYKALYERKVYMPKYINLACTSNDASTAPYLLTGENSMENVGYEACEKIFRVLDGETLGDEVRFIPSKNRLITSVGCGCQKSSAYDYSKERGVLLDIDAGYFGELNFAREGMLFIKDYDSFVDAIAETVGHIKGFKELHFCMNEGWDDPNLIIKDVKRNPYTDKMHLFYSRYEKENGPEIIVGNERMFSKEEMFPDLFLEKGDPTIFVFHALHYLDRNYGYIVLNNGQSPTVYDYTYNFWLHDVADGIESLCRLQSVNYMFYTDIMTGLYNRNGLNTMLADIIEQAQKEDKVVLVALADMNFLKKINDTYGHEEGDKAIQSAAKLLKETRVPVALAEKNFRIGGDEFVKIAIGDFTEEHILKFKDDLYEAADNYTKNSGKPYVTQMSLGYCIGAVDTKEEMEGFLSKADKQMYAEKVRLKANRE
ncbi:MAG: GGDEF domain-containing protein [Lachnospiraceae bacterium]|nr:GGDEF domain-containing protein [Lachnospiraceae bacterium]